MHLTPNQSTKVRNILSTVPFTVLEILTYPNKIIASFVPHLLFLSILSSLVQKAIENAMIGRTVVIVAHRLSTIQCADQIVVMDNRKIVDVGTHEELLTGCRRYQDLIKRQSTMMRDVSAGTIQKLLPTDISIDEE